MSLLYWGVQTELCTALRLRSHQLWIKGKDDLSLPAVNTLSNESQDTMWHFCWKGTLLAHVQLGVYQDPQVLFYQPAFQLGSPQYVLVHGVVPPQVQELTFLLSAFDYVSVGPFLQSVKVPLDGSMMVCLLSSANLLREYESSQMFSKFQQILYTNVFLNNNVFFPRK